MTFCSRAREASGASSMYGRVSGSCCHLICLGVPDRTLMRVTGRTTETLEM